MSGRKIALALLTMLIAAPASFAQQQAPPPPPAQDQQGQRDRGQDRGGDRGGRFDPARFREQMEARMKEQLAVNDDEWKVIQPKMEKVMEGRRDTGGGGFGGMFGGRRGGEDRGPGANNNNAPQSAVQTASRELRDVLDNKDSTADQIKAKLTAYREAREKSRQTLAGAQKDLKEVLTQRQEAVLVSMGILD